MPLHHLQHFCFSCIVAAVVFSAQYILAAPILGDGSGDSSLVYLEAANRTITGLRVSWNYADSVLNSSAISSTQNSILANFCDMLSYYEMLRKVNAKNETTIDALTDLETLLEQNLEDTCLWISVQVCAGRINVSASYPTLFQSDSCSMNQTTAPYREVCALYRGSEVTLSALISASSHIGTVQNINECEWIRERAPQSNVLQLYNCSV